MATLQLISDFVGKTIGNFYVEAKIGDGGYGTVYRARHLTLDDRVVAIKVLKQEALHDATLIERFRNEARAAARVKHPGIVRIDDIGEHAETGTHYIVMEYLRGVDLQQWLAPHRDGLPLAEVLALLYDVADALDAVHDAGIIHRDLKPENLFRQEDGLVKILDLGIAKLTPDLVGSFRTATNIVLGSPGYFAPELADPKRKAAIDRRSDVFSLAAVAYELITHDKAWHYDHANPWSYVALVQKADEKRPRDLRIVRPEVPAGLSHTLLGALSKDPSERPRTAGSLVQKLAEDLPGGYQIIARRAEVIRALQGLPAIARASTSPPATKDAPRSRTPVIEVSSLPASSPPVASSAANDPTVRVQAPSVPSAPRPDGVVEATTPPATDNDPSRIPTLVPSRITTLVPAESSPDRIATLRAPVEEPTVPASIAPLPTGPIPEAVAELDASNTGPMATHSDEVRPAALTASGTLAAPGAAQPDGRVESRSVLLDPTLAASDAAAPLGAGDGTVVQREPVERTRAERPTKRAKRRALAAAGFAVVAAATVIALARKAVTPGDSSAANRASSTVAVTIDAGPAAPSASPADAARLIDAAPAAPPVDAAPDGSAPPVADEVTADAPAQPGKVEVYANELTDVFLVAGSRTKFLGTTPLPRASVPAGTVTLELRSRGRKATRKVTIRPGRRARVEHTWSSN